MRGTARRLSIAKVRTEPDDLASGFVAAVDALGVDAAGDRLPRARLDGRRERARPGPYRAHRPAHDGRLRRRHRDRDAAAPGPLRPAVLETRPAGAAGAATRGARPDRRRRSGARASRPGRRRSCRARLRRRRRRGGRGLLSLLVREPGARAGGGAHPRGVASRRAGFPVVRGRRRAPGVPARRDDRAQRRAPARRGLLRRGARRTSPVAWRRRAAASDALERRARDGRASHAGCRSR